MRLHFKITIFLLIVGLLPLLFLGGYSIFSVEETIRVTRNQALMSLATEVGKEVSRTVLEGYHSILQLSENVSGSDIREENDRLKEILIRTQRYHSIIKDLTLVDRQGKVRASVFYTFRGDWASTTWFQEALGGRTLLSRIHAVIYPFQRVMTAAVPLRESGGEIAAVLMGQLDTAPIQQLITEVTFGDEGMTYLVDDQGNVLAGPIEDEILEPFPFTVEQESWATGKGGTQLARGTKGDVVVTIAPVDQPSGSVNLGWNVALVQPVEAAYRAQHGVRQGLYSAAIGSLLVVILLSNLLSRHISRRIGSLVRATRGLGTGRGTVRVQDLGTDEIGELGMAFNRASEELSES
ncbi:MAG: cache and HAMP domain-containing protein, partial [Desulfovibrionales bacterium]